MVIPPRFPQFNWVDLGLPSGTLWLDRMVGAPSPNEPGLFYQWGDTIGHSLAEGYEFSLNNYTEKGLNLISSDLDDAHDAARAFYGPEAKMPSYSQLEELINNCVMSRQDDGIFLITSNINGHSIKMRGNGYIENLVHHNSREIRAWSNRQDTEVLAFSIRVAFDNIEMNSNNRYWGLNVMAVHS